MAASTIGSAEVQTFLVRFEQMKEGIDDKPGELFDLAAQDDSIRDMSTRLYW